MLRDDVQDRTMTSSSIVVDYLAQTEPSATSLVPADPYGALQTRRALVARIKRSPAFEMKADATRRRLRPR